MAGDLRSPVSPKDDRKWPTHAEARPLNTTGTGESPPGISRRGETKKEFVPVINASSAFLYESVDDFLCPFVEIPPPHWEVSRVEWVDSQPVAEIFDPFDSGIAALEAWAETNGCSSCEEK